MLAMIALRIEPEATPEPITEGSGNAASSPRSKLGGVPDLPDGIDVPIDNRSRPMLFLGQINFAELPRCGSMQEWPSDGVLFWFLNRDLSFANPKDRHAFRILWSKASKRSAASENVESVPLQNSGILVGEVVSRDAENDSVANSHRLFGELPHFIDEAKQIAAFAANGVSWSAVRAKDSCYEHLVAAAQQWQLLWFLPTALSSKQVPDLALMINQADLKDGALNKAWMVPLR